MKPVIVVHGGAWAIPDDMAKASVDGVKSAATAGFLAMKRGGSALDAVELAVRALEDNPTFDAGTFCTITALTPSSPNYSPGRSPCAAGVAI